MFGKNKIKELNKTIDRQNNIIKEYEDKISNLSSQLELANLHIDRKNKQIETLNKNNNTLDEENTELKIKLKSYKDSKDLLKYDLENQSAGIQETTATIEEINASLQQIKDQVIQSSINNQHNIQTVKDFSNAINNLNTDIEKLSNTKTEIGDILSKINDIVNQTNILALNATIEAAHAGEYGKGFSIIANEVRKLSTDAKANNKEIENILRTIEKTIDIAKDQMTVIVRDTNDFKEDTIARAEHIQTITTTIEEIATGTEQISIVMQQQAEESQELLKKIDEYN